MADVVPADTPPGHYGREELFTEEGKQAIPEKGYNKFSCFRAVKLIRTMMNRIRTLSFRIDKKCRKQSEVVGNKSDCEQTFSYLKSVLGVYNRQREIISNVCQNE